MIAFTEYVLRAYDKEGNLILSTGKERDENKIEALANELRTAGYTTRIKEYVPTCTGI